MKGETKIGTMADWTLEERAAKEKEWLQALFALRLQKATGQLDNPMKIKSLRRDIARLKTLAARGGESPSVLMATSATSATPAATSGGAETTAAEAPAKAPKTRPVKKATPAVKKATKAPAGKPASKAKPKAQGKAKA